MKRKIMIAISGRSGCGNTTVSRMVAEALDLEFINFTFRSLAKERDLDLKTILDLAAIDDAWDKEVDSRQLQLARDSGGCVLGSRLAVWMLKEADLKVYLYAKPKIRVKRIIEREGGNIDDVSAFTAERDMQDHDRYMRIYNINTDDYYFVDLVIKTDYITPEQITEIIVKKAKEIIG